MSRLSSHQVTIAKTCSPSRVRTTKITGWPRVPSSHTTSCFRGHRQQVTSMIYTSQTLKIQWACTWPHHDLSALFCDANTTFKPHNSRSGESLVMCKFCTTLHPDLYQNQLENWPFLSCVYRQCLQALNAHCKKKSCENNAFQKNPGKQIHRRTYTPWN